MSSFSSLSPPVAPVAPGAETDPIRSAIQDAKQQRAKLKKAAQEFEGVFIGQMLKQMRKSMASGDNLFGSSPEAKQYQEMMDDAMAQHLSQNGSFGLAKVLVKRLEKTLPANPEDLVRQIVLQMP